MTVKRNQNADPGFPESSQVYNTVLLDIFASVLSDVCKLLHMSALTHGHFGDKGSKVVHAGGVPNKRLKAYAFDSLG